MIVIDANILIASIWRESPHRLAAKSWLETNLSSGQEDVGIPWIVALAFLRITTRRDVVSEPLSVEDAFTFLEEWLNLPSVFVLEPGPRHTHILKNLLLRAGTAGNLTSDAHIAAIAIEHNAELASFDKDFTRFPGLRCRNLLKA